MVVRDAAPPLTSLCHWTSAALVSDRSQVGAFAVLSFRFWHGRVSEAASAAQRHGADWGVRLQARLLPRRAARVGSGIHTTQSPDEVWCRAGALDEGSSPSRPAEPRGLRPPRCLQKFGEVCARSSCRVPQAPFSPHSVARGPRCNVHITWTLKEESARCVSWNASRRVARILILAGMKPLWSRRVVSHGGVRLFLWAFVESSIVLSSLSIGGTARLAPGGYWAGRPPP